MKYFILTILTSCLVFLLFPQTTHAYATGTVDHMMEGLNKNMSTTWLSPEIAAIIDCDNPGSAEKTSIGEYCEGMENTGALHSMGNNIAMLMGTKPISSTEYIASIMNNIGIPGATPAYAQQTGIGFNVFQPVLTLWQAFRNTAYMLYVIVFVAIGFMIMFRRKIDPQTVISVQQALPRLVVTLLLITFSYAIAGFIIDLMYVAIYIPAYILTANGVFTDASTVVNILMNHNLFGIILNPSVGNTSEVAMSEQPAQAAMDVVNSLMGTTISGASAYILERLGKLIFGAMMLFAMFRLFITLGIGFFKIILSVVFAPIQIMLNAVPGSDAFSKWLRGLISNVAMFPAVAIIFMVAAALMGPVDYRTALGGEGGVGDNPWGVSPDVGYQSGNDLGADTGWVPPFLIIRGGGSGQQYGFGGGVNPVIALVGFFAIMIAPQVANMTRDFLQVDKSPYGGAIGEYAGSAMGFMTAPYRKLQDQNKAQKQNEALGKAIGRNISGPASSEGPHA